MQAYIRYNEKIKMMWNINSTGINGEVCSFQIFFK